MPPLTIADFPPDLQVIIDPLQPTPVREGACPSEQPVCDPDARITAQLEEKPLEERLLPWRIANAEKGDLFLCPGGPGGMIGGLLSQLVPPQIFSHMGILIDDFVHIRHATVNAKRLKRFPHRAGTIISNTSADVTDFFGLDEFNDAPTDGFQEKALRFGWPGTLTQSVEQAYMSATQPSKETLGYPDDASRDAYLDSFKLKDAESGESFFIDALTFGPAKVLMTGTVKPCQPVDADLDWKTVWPVVVKPCDKLESSQVRQALHRLADVAVAMRGHYRFFSYTRADVGLDPSKLGPVMLEIYKPEPTCPTLKVIPTPSTQGMVCSTFVWLAVDAANKQPGKPKIILDGRPRGLVPVANVCSAELPPATTVDKWDAQTPDGLYKYDPSERLNAGEWLYRYMYECEVVKEVSESTDLQAKLDGIFKGSSTMWTMWKIAKLLMMFSPVQVGLILGISGETLEFLIRLLSNMPDDVATQVVNAFANDDCRLEAKDSDEWKTNTGAGLTVSPDNILRSWASPTRADNEYVHGLYGHNVRADLQPPTYEEAGPPPSIWKISQGFGGARGTVKFKGVGTEGARVRIGCTRFRSGAGGVFTEQNLPSGRYWATAWIDDPATGLTLESSFVVNKKSGFPFSENDPPELKTIAKGRAIEIEVGQTTGIDFELHEPADNRRRIWIDGHMDLVNRYAIGKDWWDHPPFTRGPFLMGEVYPDRPEFATLRAASSKQLADATFQVDDWGYAQLQLTLEIAGKSDTNVPAAVRYKTVKVTCRARLKETDDDDWQHESTFYVFPKNLNSDPGHTMTPIDLVRSEHAWPVRAHIELTFHNDRR